MNLNLRKVGLNICIKFLDLISAANEDYILGAIELNS